MINKKTTKTEAFGNRRFSNGLEKRSFSKSFCRFRNPLGISKRGQVTVFIIIGLVILLTYFMLAYFKKEGIEETEIIQPELIPVQQYVQTCTEILAREAIDIIGINGGYVYFPQWIQTNPNSYLRLSPIEDLKNPYWWYDGEYAVPPLDFIAKQIEDYTKAGISGCISNFSAFQNQYDVIELGSFNVIAEIGEEDVSVKTVYPIEIRDKFNKTLAKLQKFPVTIPIRLKQVYNLAAKIMERENKDYFVEKKVIDLISLDDDEIPTTGIDVQCGKKQWEMEKIEKKLKQLLYTNLPYIKIKGTKFNKDSRITPYQLQDTNPYSLSDSYNDSYYFYHYIWDIADVTYPNMHVSFNYDPGWDIRLYARPNKGIYLESNPQKAGQMLSLLCLHIWHFTYDVVLPVKVAITDDETSKNERYSFNFAFKAQINHNQPDRTNFAVASFKARDTYLEEEYCADTTNEITIYAQDKVTKENIRNVNLTLTCGRYACNIGTTKSYWEEDPSGIPKLKKRVPYCTNAILRGTKEGYEEGETFIQTGRRLDTPPEERIGETFILEMRPTKGFNYTIVKHNIIGQGISGAKSLDNDEKAVITVKNAEEEFQSESAYSLNLTSPLKLLAKDNFDYDLEIFVADNESIKGGYNAKWTVTQNQIRLGKNITFHIIEKDFESDEEKFLFFAGLKEYSKKVPPPEIK